MCPNCSKEDKNRECVILNPILKSHNSQTLKLPKPKDVPIDENEVVKWYFGGTCKHR